MPNLEAALVWLVMTVLSPISATMLVACALHIGPALHGEYTQRVRYQLALAAGLTSTVGITTMLVCYGPKVTYTSLQNLQATVMPLGVLVQTAIAVYVITTLFSVWFAVHCYRRPALFARKRGLYGLPVYTGFLRLARSRKPGRGKMVALAVYYDR